MPTSRHILNSVLTALMMGSFLSALPAWGDVIRLKNGQTMEGIILQERESEIVLGLGVGEVTLKRSRIAAIDKSTGAELKDLQRSWKSRYIIHEKYAPPAFDDLIKGLSELDRHKREAVQSYKNITQAISNNAALQHKIAEEQHAFIDVSNRLKEADPKADLRTYNQLVRESNRLSSALVVKRGQITQHQKTLRSSEKRIAAYQENLAVLSTAYEKRRDQYRDQHGPGKDADFFKEFDARLEKHRGTIHDAVIPHDQYGQHMVVPVQINDTVTVQLLVDTGASLVVLDRKLARRLGARPVGKPINLTMADGSISKGTPVILDEVVVGDAKARHVEGVLIDSQSDQRFDGLLGMSFLKHFNVSYNPSRDELVLRSFKAD